jgi:hypothetical protein
MLVHGGMHKKSKKNYKGGQSPSPWSPQTLAGPHNLGPTPPAGGDNYNFNPAGGYFSNQVGGGYGFTDGASLIPSFAGSYFPVTKVCTAGAPDNNSRGGNNFGQGGGSGIGQSVAQAATDVRDFLGLGAAAPAAPAVAVAAPVAVAPASPQKGGGRERNGGAKKYKQRGCKGGKKTRKTKKTKKTRKHRHTKKCRGKKH